jgi:hypothetical protein
VRSEEAVALVGDRLFEVADDLGSIGVVGEPRAGAVEIGAERLVAGVFDVVRASVQVDADDFLHG